jgi:hypothetical protein
MRYHHDYRTKTANHPSADVCAGTGQKPTVINLTVMQQFVKAYVDEIRDLVCCDIYDRAHQITWGRDFYKVIRSHESCYWMELAARAAEERANLREPCACPRCSRMPLVRKATVPEPADEPVVRSLPEAEPLILSDDDWKKAVHERLSELGMSYLELAAEARGGTFSSNESRKLWLLIGGTM